MKIIAKCPKCGNNLTLDERAADRRVRCIKCSKLFRIPGLQAVPKAFHTASQAKSTVFVDESGKIYG